MRRPVRKAAQASQRTVTNMLVKDAKVVDVGSESSVAVFGNDIETDEEPVTITAMSTRGRRRKERTTDGAGPSNTTKKVFLDQIHMLVSDTEDSDYDPIIQPDEDNAGGSSSDDDSYASSNEEEMQVPERAKPSKDSKVNAKPRAKTEKKKNKNLPKSGHNVHDNLNWKAWEKEFEDWVPCGSDGEIDLDALAQRKGNDPVDVREQPSNLLMPLLPFQKEWLAWGLKQEESEYKGGILADEMGMGKTIQAISLILCSCSLRSGNSHSKNPSMPCPTTMEASHSKTKVLPQIKATLVVCPLVAVIQWRNEIARFTSQGSIKVLVYHGANRCKDATELAKYDIVLTTYSIVEVEHRKKMMPAKEKCQWCGRLFLPERLSVHQRFFCGPTAERTEKQAKQVKRKQKNVTSGKISKKKLNNEEEDEIDDIKRRIKGKHISKGSIRKYKTQNSVDGKQMVEGISSDEDRKPNKKDTKKKNADVDNSAAGPNNGSASSVDVGSSILHSVKWDRIILDEAHFIKDRRCSTSKAVFSLESFYKWALSGTPLQNRVGELYSLVRFLQIYPYSYYFCKQCDCKSLDYSFGKDWQKCSDCGHSPVQHFCWWNKYIANPIKRYGYIGDGRKALILLKHKVLNSIVLRRTKIERAADLALPPRVAFLRRDNFDAREEDFYQALYTQSQSQFNTYIAAGTLVNNYAHIFDLLTRLRQAVDHPYLVVYSKTAAQCPNNQNNVYDSVKDTCGICHDEADDPMSALCRHTFCRSCIQEYISNSGQSSCPTCLKPLTIDLTERKIASNHDSGNQVKGYKRSSILNRINLDNFQTSTKIDALREEIELMQQKDGAAKAIVFSQFTSFLELISFSLQKSGIKCLQLVGSMSIQARDQTIERFTNDPHYKVFLMSLKAGGVALNLTVASHVFLMDPWWNPAVEQQAQDRIHRLGQYKPMRVVRFVIANTIEERILRLQEKKQLVFEGTVGGSTEALGRLTEEDLRFLFTN